MGRLLIAALICIVCCVPVASLGRSFMIPEELRGYSAPFPPGILEKIEAAQLKADMMNVGLVGGIIGAFICEILSVVAVAGRSGNMVKTGIVGLVSGLVLGAAGGAASAFAWKTLLTQPLDPYAKGVLTQIWLNTAIGVALAITLMLTAPKIIAKQATLAVVVCSMIAAAFYPLAASFLFPLEKSDVAVPDGTGNRALWIGLPILLYAIAIGRSRLPAVAAEQPAVQDPVPV